MPHRIIVFLGLAAVLGHAVSGCGKGASVPVSTARRIVSYSPAITQMVVDLSCGSWVVGTGAFDPAKPPTAQVVGDLYNTDYERLLALKPTDIFLQPAAAQGVPERLTEMANRYGWKLHVYHIETLADVLNVLYDPEKPEQSVGSVLDAPLTAQGLRNQIAARLAAIAQITATRPSPRVLLVVGLNPLTAVGGDSFLGDLLRFAGGANALTGGSRYPVLDREKLLTIQPNLVVLVGAASDLTATGPSAEGSSNPAVPGVDPAILRRLDDSFALLPSTTVARVTAKLAKLLHPELAEQIDWAMSDNDRP